MAMSDLITALEGFELKIEPALQDAMTTAVIKLIDDQSADVQTNAISCLSLLVRKFEPAKVLVIVDKVGESLVDGKEELLDIYSTGVNAVITNIPTVRQHGSAVDRESGHLADRAR
jgi:hypothetical protein